jgi:hypothetical protein
MRKAAGIILVVFGAAYLGLVIVAIVHLLVDRYYRFGWNPMGYFWAAMGVLSVLFITAGIFCLRRKYWGLCLASSVLFFVFMPPSSAYLLEGLQHLYRFLPPWLFMSLLPVWMLPVIFVSLTRSEWKAIAT